MAEFIDVDGLKTDPLRDPAVVRQAMQYKPDDGEVIVACYPKCGSNWTVMTALLLMRRGEPFRSAKEWFTSFAFLEKVPEFVERMSKPRCVKTHLPFDRLNYSPNAKYIYVSRQPADCLVSCYHFLNYMPLLNFQDFDQLFDHFVSGDLPYGDYFDHLLSWYDQRDLPNVLFLTFESMKKDPKGAVLKMAEFLDDNLVSELLSDDESMLKEILHHSSFESMKQSVNIFFQEAFTTPQFKKDEHDIGAIIMNKYFRSMEAATKKNGKSSGNFIRRGQIGDGKVALSERQKERLNARILEKTAHSDVMNLWKDV